jgi:hypothetical protein
VFERLARLFGLLQRPRPPFVIDRFERRQIGISGSARKFGAGDRIEPDKMRRKPPGEGGGEVDPATRIVGGVEHHQQILVAHHPHIPFVLPSAR